MAIKIMLQIQGCMFDFWEVRSVEKGERYNEESTSQEYIIIINKTSTSTNVNEVIFSYETEEERDEELSNLKNKLQEIDTVILL